MVVFQIQSATVSLLVILSTSIQIYMSCGVYSCIISMKKSRDGCWFSAPICKIPKWFGLRVTVRMTVRSISIYFYIMCCVGSCIISMKEAKGHQTETWAPICNIFISSVLLFLSCDAPHFTCEHDGTIYIYLHLHLHLMCPIQYRFLQQLTGWM